MTYRVDNVPLFLRPLFFLYSYTVGILLCFLCLLIHLTCRIRFEGDENLVGRQNFIFCQWHTHLLPYFVTFVRHRRPHVWMNHPAWFMKPVHVAIRLIGVKDLVLGSTGHDGQEAATRLVEFLKKGNSTLVTPDGPAGPPKTLKKGVLHLSLQSGVPIVPMKIETPCAWILKGTWDGKRCPLPFSEIRVFYGKPIVVTQENFEEASQQLQQVLR